MKGYHGNIEKLTAVNSHFRQVVYTGQHTQLVLMCLAPGEEIGVEVHQDTDQFFRFESGTGKVLIDTLEYAVSDGDVAIVPAGATHNVINTSSTVPLKMYTLYSPPHHKDKTVHTTKADAQNDTEHFDGMTSE